MVWSASDRCAYSFRSQHTGSRPPGRAIYKSSSIAISRCLSISLISCCSGREEYHRARRGLPTSGSRNELPGLLLGRRRSLVCQAASTIWSSDRNRVSTKALVLQADEEPFSVHVLLQLASKVGLKLNIQIRRKLIGPLPHRMPDEPKQDKSPNN